jgi:hypothetical protein
MIKKKPKILKDILYVFNGSHYQPYTKNFKYNKNMMYSIIIKKEK